MRGCQVADSTAGVTATRTDECATATVTDVVISCSGTGTTACSTKTEITRSGCSITATTTTARCTAAPTGNARRQTGEDACPVAGKYVVYPRDGKNGAETAAIYSEMQRLLQDDTKIAVSDTKYLGVNFWRVYLEPDQIQAVREIPNVSPCAKLRRNKRKMDANKIIQGCGSWYGMHRVRRSANCFTLEIPTTICRQGH
jgi:hypothetical protein